MIYFKCRKTNKVYANPTEHYPVVDKNLRHLLKSGFLKAPDCDCVHGCNEQKRQVKACSKYAKPL